ncbi:MAG: membrane protein insertase YidC [Candidatus Kapaibacterium sp.]
MDRQSTLGFVLIAIIIIGWMVWNTYHDTPVNNTNKPQQQTQTQKQEQQKLPEPQFKQEPRAVETPEKKVTIETDKYKAIISSKGMAIIYWELKGMQAWYGAPTNLIKEKSREFTMMFTTQSGQKVDTRYVDFEFNNLQNSKVSVKGENSFTLTATLNAGNGAQVIRTLTFHGNSYHVDADFQFVNMDNILPNTQRFVDIGWNKGLQYQEMSSSDESNAAKAFASMNGTLEETDAAKYNEPVNAHQSGIIDFIGTKTKYFIAAIINKNANKDAEYFADGVRYGAPENGAVETYSVSYRVRYNGGTQKNSYQLYLGPLDYDIVKTYGMESTVDLGWKWLVRPIGEWIMMPAFKIIHSLIPNFGIAIIVFSILMKLLLTPLSRGQMQSSLKMKALQPEIEKLRKQYADDPTGMQQAQMKLYGEYGINPMGGCLPLLLQMPILYALYNVLTTNIHLRHAMFIPGWIPDLSVPDHILHLPFSLMGLTAISGMALVMGITMFIQQRMTITDPNQKAMIYMMPVMMTFMFSNLPSGLNLYYLTFNFLGIAQQVWMTKFSKKQISLDELKKMPKKEGWLQKRLRMAQEMAEQQGRPMPNNPYLKNNNGTQNNKNKKKK